LLTERNSKRSSACFRFCRPSRGTKSFRSSLLYSAFGVGVCGNILPSHSQKSPRGQFMPERHRWIASFIILVVVAAALLDVYLFIHAFTFPTLNFFDLHRNILFKRGLGGFNPVEDRLIEPIEIRRLEWRHANRLVILRFFVRLHI